MDNGPYRNCYICYRQTTDRFPMLTKLKYSKSLLFLLVNQFLDTDQKYRFNRDEIVCAKCMFTLNRYDLASLTAKRIEQEIKDAIIVTDQTYRQGNVDLLDPNDDVSSSQCESEFNAYQLEVDEQMEGGNDVNVMREEEGVHTANAEVTNDDEIYNTDEKSSEFEQETLEIYVCEYCFQEFDSPLDLKDHVTYKCSTKKSNERPESAAALAKIENRICLHCDKIFSSVKQFKNHDGQFHRPKKCGVCQKTFSSQIELREHKRIEHELDISFRCPICERAFSGELNLHRHIQTHTDLTSPLSCSICGQIEQNADDLETHVAQHNNRLECTVCGKILKHKSNLVLHMRIHTGEKFFQCSKCSKEFVHKSSLRMHLQTTHTEVRTKQCTECSMRFKTTSQLNQHMVTHSGKRNHECSACGKLFVQRHNMLAHYRMHTDSGKDNTKAKRHICHNCDKVFSRPSHLQTHIRRKHTIAAEHNKSVERHLLNF